VNYEIAEDDELPHQFTGLFWKQPVGLVITSIATLVLVNTLKLESISTAGSIGFLLIFAIVNAVGFKLAKDINGNKIIPLTGLFLCSVALIALVVQQYSSNITGILISAGIIFLSFGAEFIYKKWGDKEAETK